MYLGDFSANEEDYCNVQWTTTLYDENRDRYLDENTSPISFFSANNTMKVYQSASRKSTRPLVYKGELVDGIEQQVYFTVDISLPEAIEDYVIDENTEPVLLRPPSRG